MSSHVFWLPLAFIFLTFVIGVLLAVYLARPKKPVQRGFEVTLKLPAEKGDSQ